MRPGVDVLGADGSKSTGHPVADHGVPHRLAHDQSDSSRLRAGLPRPHVEHEGRARSATSTPNGSGEVGAPAHSMGRGQHRSGGEAGAALTATRRKDGATGAGAHPEPEAVGLGPTTVVGLERTLGHEGLRGLTGGAGRGRPPLGRYRTDAGDARSPLRYNAGAGVGQTGRSSSPAGVTDSRHRRRVRVEFDRARSVRRTGQLSTISNLGPGVGETRRSSARYGGP